MRRHKSFQLLLARREELSPAEGYQLEAHLQTCVQCRRAAATFEHQDDQIRMLRSLSMPLGSRSMLFEKILRSEIVPPTPTGWPRVRVAQHWRRYTAIGLAACFVAALFIARLNQVTVIPASANTLLQQTVQSQAVEPYSGTAHVMYASLDESTLPQQAIRHVGQHEVVTRWQVANQSHFRASVRTIQPAIDSGTLTTVMKDSTVITYDTRTETAGLSHEANSSLLGYLQMGASYGITPPTPAESVQQYLNSLKAGAISSGVQPFARVVGHARLLGRPVDVIDFGPTTVTCVSTTPGFPGCRSSRGIGTARAWVDASLHIFLRYKEYRSGDSRSGRSNFDYQVTSLAVGTGPSSGDLAYRPPVPVLASLPLRIVWSSSLQAFSGPVPAGFVSAPPPSGFSHAPTNSWGVTARPTGPLNETSAVDVLYGSGLRRIISGPDGRVARYYLNGAYLLVQERVQARGLPSALRAGTTEIAGRCRVWTGRYQDGQDWLAFARGGVSILMTTNALPAHDLVRYVAATVCT